MEFYAIRHKPSGMFLPAFAKKRGHTNAEPTDALAPRLFMKAHHAKAALAWWLEGAFYQVIVDFEYGDYDLRSTPKPHRKADDMEVVAITLTTKEN